MKIIHVPPFETYDIVQLESMEKQDDSTFGNLWCGEYTFNVTS